MRPARAEGPPLSRARFENIRAKSVEIAAPLSAEDCQAQSMEVASPIKWHLAHTTWFFETFVLLPFAKGYQAWNPAAGLLYNSYYEALGERVARAERGLVTRPSLGEVLDYRAHVDRALAVFLDSRSSESEKVDGRLGEADAAEALRRLELGLQHEQQHQELMLTDLKHLLSRHPLQPAYRSDATAEPGSSVAASTPPLRWIANPGGVVQIGRPDTEGFGFDNERPAHRRYLEPFAIAHRLVTSGEFLEFVDSGGYREPRFWLSDGWAVVQGEQWTAPFYWNRSGDQWTEFTLHGERPLDARAPVVHLSYFEADAYARFRGARLPREDEWEVMAKDLPRTARENFLEDGRGAPLPLDARCADDGSPQQMFGDVWEWTSSQYSAYPGFRADEGAIGEYNGKFMCDQFVLRGGSCATPRSHIRATYRNFFPARARWQFSGLRLARDQV